MKISHLINKSKNIVEGYTNLIFKNEIVEAYALQRSFICTECKELNKLGFCNKCGCYIAAKIRAPEEQCPKGYWKKYKL